MLGLGENALLLMQRHVHMLICMLDLADLKDHAIKLFHFKRSYCETLKHCKINHSVLSYL